MDSKELLSKLKDYYLNNLDLMRHLHDSACWEYVIHQNNLNDEKVKLNFYLCKKDNDTLEIIQKNLEIIPDLILYFTEDSILQLIQDNPVPELYFERYRKMMNSKPNNKIDSKINKSRFNLLRLGYQKWQKDFKF
jgi:hypothetical protein